jgi:hypothetical protein
VKSYEKSDTLLQGWWEKSIVFLEVCQVLPSRPSDGRRMEGKMFGWL